MEFGICSLNCIALRRDPFDESEMVSQLLYGETFQVLTRDGDWLLVHLDHDHYEGWVPALQVQLLPEKLYRDITADSRHFSEEMITFITDPNGQLQILTLGITLPRYREQRFYPGEQPIDFDGQVNSEPKGKQSLVLTAYKYLNAPFLWGGRTPFGIDCSGFTQMVYRINGHDLFRDANQQASQGEVLSFIEESEPGDLAFFDNEEGEITHAGILLSGNHIIHCHGKVRIDRIDQSGIYNTDTQRHTHRLRVMKRIF